MLNVIKYNEILFTEIDLGNKRKSDLGIYFNQNFKK